MGALDQFRVDAPVSPVSEPRPEGPGPDETDWPDLTVIAFDQALANTGWVQVQFKRGHLPIVIEVGMLGTEAPDLKGHAANLTRSLDLYHQFGWVLDRRVCDLVVHETPPVGSHMSRPESSLLAADGLWHTADRLGLTVKMVANQRAKKILAGNAKVDKRGLRLAVLQHLPDLERRRPANEHTYDAAALALTAAWEAPR